MGSIFWSPKKQISNIPVNLVPFFSGVLFLFCHFLKSGVTNELKSQEQKSQGYLFKTGQNFAVVKTLVWSAYVRRTTTATFFLKKRVIYELGSHFNQIRFI